MKNKTLLVDGSSLLRSSYEATKNEDNELVRNNSNGIFGFLVRLRFYLSKHKYNKVNIYFDGNDSSKLVKQIYPTYKANRPKKEDSFVSQRDRAYDLLKIFLPTFLCDDGEADAYIGAYVASKDIDEQIHLLTGDRDYMGLIEPSVGVLYINKKFNSKYGKNNIGSLVTHKNHNKFFGYTHENVYEIKAICGDAGDNVINIKGVKENSLFKAIPEIVNTSMTLDDIFRYCNEKVEKGVFLNKRIENVYKRILSGENKSNIKDLVEKNFCIVNLKSPLVKKNCIILELQKGLSKIITEENKKNKGVELIKKLDEYKITPSIMNHFKSFKYFFKPYIT